MAYKYDENGNLIKVTDLCLVNLVEGADWKGDKSSYTYNGLFVRINNTQTSQSRSVYSRDYLANIAYSVKCMLEVRD